MHVPSYIRERGSEKNNEICPPTVSRFAAARQRHASRFSPRTARQPWQSLPPATLSPSARLGEPASWTKTQRKREVPQMEFQEMLGCLSTDHQQLISPSHMRAERTSNEAATCVIDYTFSRRLETRPLLRRTFSAEVNRNDSPTTRKANLAALSPSHLLQHPLPIPDPLKKLACFHPTLSGCEV